MRFLRKKYVDAPQRRDQQRTNRGRPNIGKYLKTIDAIEFGDRL